MRNWFVIILSLYIFGLGLFPCQDQPMEHAQEHITILGEANNCSVSSPDDTEDADHAHKICSPLCSCACCGITLEHMNFEAPQVTEHLCDYTPKQEVFYASPFLDSYNSSIWNPPKFLS